MKVSEILQKYSDFSPYEVAKLAAVQHGVKFNPQALYSAVKRGQWPSFRDEQDKIRITADVAAQIVATWGSGGGQKRRLSNVEAD